MSYLWTTLTTLGGDDGIAVAYALAILDGDYKHPALEVLITINEETGMQRAANNCWGGDHAPSFLGISAI